MNNAGIRTCAEYLEGLRDDREIWTRGARVKDVTAEAGRHPLLDFWIASMRRPTVTR